MAKTPRKIRVHRSIRRVWSQAHPVLLTSIRGEAAEAEEAVAGVEVEAEAEAITKKENGTAFSTRMTTTQTIAQTRKGSKLSSKKRERKKRGRVP
jgi:hypothetical protein